MAKRAAATLTVPALVEELERYELKHRAPRGDGEVTLEWRFVYEFVSPAGRREVTKKHLNGEQDGWPMPGTYEVSIVDSNDEEITDEPWRAVHEDQASLATSPRDAGSTAIFQLLEEGRLARRDSRNDAEFARKQYLQARESLLQAERERDALQAEKGRAIAQTEKAVADMLLAQERQAAAEEAYNALRAEVDNLEPVIRTAIDQGVAHFKAMFGFPLDPSEGSGSEATVPLPGDASPEAQATTIAVLQKVILDRDLCQAIFESGLLSWEEIRYVFWGYTNTDPGPTPNWTNWPEPNGEDESAEQEPTARQQPGGET